MTKLQSLGAHLDPVRIQAAMVTALSFSHLHDIAGMVGRTGWEGWIYPPSVDLLMYVGYRRMELARAARTSKKLGLTAFLLSSAASLAANVIALLPHAMQAALAANLAMRIVVGVWPPLAMVVTTLLGHSNHRARTERGALAHAEAQHEDEPEAQQPKLALVPQPRDTPDQPLPTDLPAQRHPAFYPAVLAHVTARQPVDEFPSREDFYRHIIELLVSHGYSSCHTATIRRHLNELLAVAS